MKIFAPRLVLKTGLSVNVINRQVMGVVEDVTCAQKVMLDPDFKLIYCE